MYKYYVKSVFGEIWNYNNTQDAFNRAYHLAKKDEFLLFYEYGLENGVGSFIYDIDELTAYDENMRV